jgi:hypothetical protein
MSDFTCGYVFDLMFVSCTRRLPMHIAPFCSVAYSRFSLLLQRLFSHCLHKMYIDIHYAGSSLQFYD